MFDDRCAHWAQSTDLKNILKYSPHYGGYFDMKNPDDNITILRKG